MKMLKPAQGGSRRPLRVTAIALSSAAIGALAVGMTSVEAQNPPVAMQAVPQNVIPAWPGYADLVEKVMPAVVSVTTKRKVSNALVSGEDEFHGNPGDLERFFEEFEGPGSEMFKRFMERFGALGVAVGRSRACPSASARAVRCRWPAPAPASSSMRRVSRHQQPRGRRCRRSDRDAAGRPRVRGQSRRHRSRHRPRGAEDLSRTSRCPISSSPIRTRSGSVIR